jgi:hypothetical protein
MSPQPGHPSGGGRAFKVVRRIGKRRVVVLETDDGMEAEVVRTRLLDEFRSANRRPFDWDYSLRIEGVDPSHDGNGTGTCQRCGAPLDNGCFSSHLPCGFKFEKAMSVYMDEWRAAPSDEEAVVKS